jgi:hypothetical protein
LNEELIKRILDLLFHIFPSGFYYKNLLSRNDSSVNWSGFILQEDPLLLQVHSPDLNEVLRNLIEHGLGPGMPAAILFSSRGSSGFQAIFGTVGEIRTKLKTLPDQDLMILIHEDINRIRPFVSVDN